VIPGTFSEEAYNEFDNKGKTACIRFFSSIGYRPTNNEEDLNIDLIFVQDGYPDLYIEVEVRGLWDFPLSDWEKYKPGWKTIHIPERKGKYAKWYGNNMFYFELNAPCTQAFIVPSFWIDPKYKVMIPNRRHKSGEYFYDIPVKELKIVNIPK
jgi:hypothetical protein